MMGPYLESIRSRVGPQCLLLPGVRAIILNGDNDILLQRRTDLACWGLPSGSVELDETAFQALKREVREETGLEIRRAEPMALYSGPSQRFKYPNGDEIQCFSVAFIIRDWAGERFVVDNVSELFPGLWTTGMSVCASRGGPRMGADLRWHAAVGSQSCRAVGASLFRG